MPIRFDGRVAIVTGAGNGLGRAHAIGLAKLGARVVVNDLGGSTDGSGSSTAVAQAVCDEIITAGGEAIADRANISSEDQVAAMVQRAMDKWGRIDILLNNAGILRDRSFAKIDMDDHDLVIAVHLTGTTLCCKAVWPIMRSQNYGRIVLTSSASGLYGNFGQASYAMAKAGMLGLMNVLHIEGQKNGINVNILVPGAGTRMTSELLTPEFVELMRPEAITPGALYLLGESAPSRFILSASAGSFARIVLQETQPIFFDEEARTPDAIADHFASGELGELALLANAHQENTRLVELAASMKKPSSRPASH